MNPSATTFLRSCRAHSSRTLVLRSPSSPALRARFHCDQRPTSCQRKTPPQQKQHTSRFSTSCVARDAQPVTDIPSAGAEMKGSDAGENIAQSVLSRANTNGSQGTTVTTTPTQASSELDNPPPSPQDQTVYRAWTGPDVAFIASTPIYTGRVSRTGTMRKAVRVTRNVQVWDKHLQKHYTRPAHALVHDPEELLREGDVVEYGAFPPSVAADRAEKGRLGKGKIEFTVLDIVTPFGDSVEQRRARKPVVAVQGEGGEGGSGFVQTAKVSRKGKVDVPGFARRGRQQTRA